MRGLSRYSLACADADALDPDEDDSYGFVAPFVIVFRQIFWVACLKSECFGARCPSSIKPSVRSLIDPRWQPLIPANFRLFVLYLHPPPGRHQESKTAEPR